MGSDDTIIDTQIKSRVKKTRIKNPARWSQIIVDIAHSIIIIVIWLIPNKDDKIKFQTSLIVIGLYMLVMVTLNYNLTKEDGVTIIPPNNEDGLAHLLKSFLATFNAVLPLIIILVMLQMFPGWLIPFSNTFGYAIVNKIYPNLLDGLLADVNESPTNPSDVVGNTMITKLKHHGFKNMFINNLPSTKDKMEQQVGEIQKSMKIFKKDLIDENGQITESGQTPFNELLKAVRYKFGISRIVWFVSILIICAKMNELNLYNLVGTD